MRFFIFLFTLTLPLNPAAAEQRVYGKWQFSGGTAAYLEILESNLAMQCRIDLLGNVIKAHGKYIENSTIEWGAIKVYNADGRIGSLPMNLEWGVDNIVLKNNTLYLDGPYGKNSFSKTNVINHKCFSKDKNSSKRM